MSKERSLSRRIGRWGLWLVVVLLALFALQVTVLAFPQILFSNHLQSGSVVVYFDGQPRDEIARMTENVEMRLHGSGYYDSSRTARVFFFDSQSKYAFFARLSLVTTKAQGFALSVFNNTYISGPNIAALAQMTCGRPRYGIWEGDPAHTIAHEIGHNYMIDRIGRDTWIEQPQWKQEGFPEYVANIALIHSDTTATLPHRIDILADGQYWDWQQRWDRTHYESALMVEFLLDVQGYTLDDIVVDSVTRDGTYAAMVEWRKGQRSTVVSP
ncbi:MAG: hypothetical protein WBP34_10930 [Thermoanaerobaculia bacterium]